MLLPWGFEALVFLLLYISMGKKNSKLKQEEVEDLKKRTYCEYMITIEPTHWLSLVTKR